MTRVFSRFGFLTLSHLGMVVMALMFSRSLAGPDGEIRVDLLPPYLLWIRDIAMVVVSLPIGWLFLLPTHLGGPTEFDIVVSAVGLGINSMLVGYIASRFSRKPPAPLE